MKFRSGFLPCLLCLLLAPAALAQSKPILQLRGEFPFGDPGENIRAHQFLDGGNKLLLVGQKTVKILDLVSGRFVESRTLEIPNYNEDNDRVISPDGSKMLVFGNHNSRGKKDPVERPASIWDLQTGKQLAVLDQTSRPVISGFWSKNGKTLATASNRYAAGYVYDTAVEVSFWDGETFKFQNSLPSDKINWWYLTAAGDKCFYSTGPVKNVLFLLKYMGDNGGPINFWDVESGKIEKTISASDGNGERRIRGISISPDEKLLSFVAQRPKSNDSERQLVVWEITRNNHEYQLDAKYEIKPTPKIYEDGVSFSPDGKYFALKAGKDLQIYESQTGEKKFEWRGIKYYPAPYYWLDENRILFFNRSSNMEALDVVTGKQLYQQPLIFEEYQSDDGSSSIVDSTTIKLHPNRNLLLTCSNQYVDVFNSLTGTQLQQIVSPPMDYTKKKPRLSRKTLVSKAGWSPDGKTVYVISDDRKSISLWQLIEN